jgi:hypothetical protein
VVQAGRRFFSVNWSSQEQLLSYLIREPDSWLKTCAIYVAGEWRLSPLIPELQQAVNNSDPLVRETAQLALERMGVNASASS